MTSPRWQETDIPVNGLQIPACRAGHGKSSLVMVHAFTDEALCWTNLAAALMDNLEVIPYNESGHGKSPGHSGPITHCKQFRLYLETMQSFLNPYQ